MIPPDHAAFLSTIPFLPRMKLPGCLRSPARSLAFVAALVGFAFTNVQAGNSPDTTRSAARVGTPPPRAPEAESLRTLETEARRSPETAERWIRFGDAAMQLARDNHDGALPLRAQSAYRRALQLDEGSVDARVGLAWVFNTTHDFAQGRDWARKALAVNPREPRAHSLLGDAAVELGNYDTALDHYQSALDAGPDLSTLSRAAHALWLTGDGRKARWLMERAIKSGGPHAENTAWCRAQLALMLWHEGAVLPARQLADRALQEAPSNALVLAIAGRIASATGDSTNALAFYRRSLAAGPNHEALAGLHQVLSAAGRTQEAEEQFQRVIEFHRAGSHAHPAHGADNSLPHTHGPASGNAQLARFYADNDRNLPEATAEAERAFENFPNVANADTLAWCLFKQGRFAEARNIQRKALRWNTPDASLLFHAGRIEAQLGDRNAARKLLHQALSLNPRFHPLDAPIAAQVLLSLGQTGP
jgi:tetratricopeptide (TPR) repeat protein